MIKQLIPWITSIITLYGMWLLSKKKWQGWVVGLINQVFWITTVLLFKTWGLFPLTIALIYIYTKGLISWRAEELNERP